MSYDINLCDPVTHDVLELDDPHDMRGGTYAMGGVNDLTPYLASCEERNRERGRYGDE